MDDVFRVGFGNAAAQEIGKREIMKALKSN